MNGIVSFRLCTLSNEELVEKVDAMTDEMYKKREIPPRHIPARPNEDYDLLVGELCKRFFEAMRWRSVNDEMPKRAKNGRTSERVLVKIKDWDKIELMWIVYVDKDDDDASYWTNDDDYWVDADIEVEFWRPIE